MADNITVVDLEMNLTEVIGIAERWASKNRFFVHEKTDKRVLYLYKRHISTSTWVSIENLGTKTRLSAWIAPKSLGPDEQGSFRKGSKIPIPVGFAVGPLGRAKKHFKRLLELIKNASDNTSVIVPIQNANPPIVSKENFAKGLVVFGVIVLLSGALSVFNGIMMTAGQTFPTLARTLLQDGIVDLVVGVILLLCSTLVKKGKAASIWLYVATVLISVGQDIAIGAKFPFFPILAGILITSQLLGLKKQGQLA